MNDRAPFVRLWLATFFGYVALGVTLQSLPDYLVNRFGAGPLGVGIVIGVASVAAAVTRPLVGRAADRGLARRVVLAGGLLGVAGGLGHLLAPNLAALFLARLCLGAGEGSVFTGAVAWILQFAATDRRGRMAGWYGLSMWAGLAVGPFAALVLLRAGGSITVWGAVTALPVLTWGLVATTAAPPARAGEDGGGWLFPAGARAPAFAFGLASCGYGAIAALILLRLAHAGLGGQEIALALFAFCFLLSRALGSPLVDRFGGHRVAVAFAGLEALGLVLVGMGHSMAMVLVGVALVAVGVSLLYPSTVEVVVNRTPTDQHGAALGALTACWDLGVLTGSVSGGLIVTLVGYEGAFTVTAALAGAGALFFAVLGGVGGRLRTTYSG
ncbi:MFS transporter [Pendulispora brunnea]|uniref:MFS transporter n=1 Tax=Pendulispora brunnea TaxID=2905690 RepID=A0ABZ2KP13_9BACT